jgi:outer membrane protein
LIMSKEVWKNKQREIRIKIDDFKALQQMYMEKYNALLNQSINRIQKEVVELVQNIGKKEDYTVIVEKRTGVVVYTRLSTDITDAVIQIYDAGAQKSESQKTFDAVSADICKSEPSGRNVYSVITGFD